MRTKEFYFLTWFVTVIAFFFVLTAIWNSEWVLVEKGFYTVCLGWITFSSFTLAKTIRDKAEGKEVTAVFLGLSWLSTVASFLIAMIAIWNTDWLLVERGYYWMGIIFITYMSFSLTKEINDRIIESKNKPFYPTLEDNESIQFVKQEEDKLKD